VLLAGPARGDEAKPPPAKPEPKLATDEEVTQAFALYEEAVKEARQLKDDDRAMQYDFAMERLSTLQHPRIVAELASLTRNPNEHVRLLAVIYLGRQTLMPALVGEPVQDFMRRYKKDEVALMSGLETLGAVRYLGAMRTVEECLEHKEFVVKKYAMECVGKLRDMRLIEEMLKQVGVDAKASLDGGTGGKEGESGGKETEGEEVSWEGVDVTYDTGTAGDGDQKMAEKIGKEQLAKNKAEAQAKAGAAGDGGGERGAGGGGTAPRGGSARSKEELVPAILRALNALTGEHFGGTRDVKKWLAGHRDEVKEKQTLLDRLEKEQVAEKKHFK
jgi:hypothetical protein